MGSKRSKRSRKEKRISQRAQSSDGSVSEVAMKLEECDIPTPIETDTVIDGVILGDIAPARPLNPVYRDNDDLPPGVKASRIPVYSPAKYATERGSDTNIDSSTSNNSAPTISYCDVDTPELTKLSLDFEYEDNAVEWMSAASSLSSIAHDENSGWTVESVSDDGIELDLGAPGESMRLSTVSMPQ